MLILGVLLAKDWKGSKVIWTFWILVKRR